MVLFAAAHAGAADEVHYGRAPDGQIRCDVADGVNGYRYRSAMRSEFGSDREAFVDEHLRPEPKRSVGIDRTCRDDEKVERTRHLTLFPPEQLWQKLHTEAALWVPEHEKQVSTSKFSEIDPLAVEIGQIDVRSCLTDA